MTKDEVLLKLLISINAGSCGYAAERVAHRGPTETIRIRRFQIRHKTSQ